MKQKKQIFKEPENALEQFKEYVSPIKQKDFSKLDALVESVMENMLLKIQAGACTINERLMVIETYIRWKG